MKNLIFRGGGALIKKSYSTDFCLSYLTNEISKGFDSGFLTGIILIDRYLSSRKFHVNIHDKWSTSADLRCGVPQRSILGHLLFSCMLTIFRKL